jgi:outer membrane PBP1 activator LpoA protein
MASTTRLLAIASLAVIAACAPRQKAPPAPLPPPPTEEKPVAPPPERVQRVAILVPLTGANAPVGTSLANAATLALADTKKAGIRLTSYDTAALGAGGAANRALADGADLILGPLLATEVPAVRAAAAPRNITILTFSNDASIAGGPVFVLGFQPGQSVNRVVSYAAGRGMRRFAGLIPDGVYGQRAAVAFTDAVRVNGGQIVSMVNFARTPAALPPAARKVTDADGRQRQAGQTLKRSDGTVAPVTQKMAPVAFEALLVADSGTIAAAFVPPLARHGARPGGYLMMGTELWNTEPGLRSATGLHGAVFAAVPDQRFQQLAGRYRARFGAAPSRLASLSYDAMLLAASKAGSSWSLGQPFPMQALADPKGFAGVDGIFRFTGNVAERGLEVQQVGPSGFTTVSPAPTAF